MSEDTGRLDVVSKVFNLRDNEWSRVWSAWMIRFFYRLSFVLGWTILVTLFVTNYGIASLPYLFLINAVFTILGSFFYSTFIDRFEKYQIMIGSLALAGILLLFASAFSHSNLPLFFALIIVAVGIFLTQFKILLYAFTEDLFTPLESERTFPVIESADIVGGIFAGLMIIGFVNFMEVSSFVYIWFGTLFLTVPFILFATGSHDLKHIHPQGRKNHATGGVIFKFKKAFSNSRHASYIKGLFLLVVLQWLIYNLLEFQYTKAVYQNVSNVILEAGSGFEHALAHDLGALFVLFSASALFVQLFLGSRIIDYLGIVGTMIVHGLLVLFSIFGLTLSYTFPMAILAKNNFTVGTVLFTNVYHSSFYAMQHNIREYVRELMEGLARPVGAIVGTFCLIFSQSLFSESSQILLVNVSMIVVAVIFLSFVWLHQKKYTLMAVNDLLYGGNKEARITAIDILAQKGHKGSANIFRRVLFSRDEPLSIKTRIIRVLPELNDPDTIDDLMRCLKSKNFTIRNEALGALARFPSLKGKKCSETYSYKKYQLVKLLKDMYKNEDDSSSLTKIIKLMAQLSDFATLDFLLDALKNSTGVHRAEVILSLRNYTDPAVAESLQSILDSLTPFQKVNAAITMSGFKDFYSEAMQIVNEFINSDDPQKISYGLFAIGELKMKQHQRVCYHYLHSRDENLRIHSAVSLLKMGVEDGYPVIVDLILSGDKKIVSKIQRLLVNIDVRISKNIDKMVKDIVQREIDSHFADSEGTSFAEWTRENLTRLTFLYELAGEYELIEDIKTYIK